MPRSARIELAGGIHHVTARGNRRQKIFVDDRDRSRFLRELALTCRTHGWLCLAYCLMGNHFHLVLETPHETLGRGMRRLGSVYAHSFNRRHGTQGHLFQERYGSVLVRTDEQFAQLLRYVAFNPVAAGLCDEPAQWRWSSHRAMLAGRGTSRAAWERTESLLEAWGGEHGSRYRRLFDEGHPVAVRFGLESPWEHRPPLETLLAGPPLDESMRAARDHGYRLAEIAAATGLHVSTVSRRTRAK